MRKPFDFNTNMFEEDTRVKFIYTSPEHHQNIEISIDGEEASVEVLMDAFQRFLGALGVPFPPNVGLEFVEYGEGDDDDDSDDEIQFTMDDDEEEGDSKDDKSKKKK